MFFVVLASTIYKENKRYELLTQTRRLICFLMCSCNINIKAARFYINNNERNGSVF